MVHVCNAVFALTMPLLENVGDRLPPWVNRPCESAPLWALFLEYVRQCTREVVVIDTIGTPQCFDDPLNLKKQGVPAGDIPVIHAE